MTRSGRTLFAVALLLLAAAVYETFSSHPSGSSEPIAQLRAEGRSGVFVEGTGSVDRLLEDDRDGSRHQRFVLRLEDGHSLLVSHNIDLAPRLEELELGDVVTFRGRYEWNERGGVLHWTHHDPALRKPGGWLQHRGVTYR